MNRMRSVGCITIIAASCLAASAAYAQNARSWVSPSGNDANTCTHSSPCRSFAGALPKTLAGGEIDALEAGGYGSVVIDKAITINGRGSLAGINGTASHGIVVNAGPNDVVYLRGLDINGGGAAFDGIHFVAGGALHVEDSNVYGFAGRGLDFAPSAGSDLYVTNSTFRNNAAGGIDVRPGNTGNARVTITGVQLAGNDHGLRVEDGTIGVVRNTVASGSTGAGFVAASAARTVLLTAENVTSSDNGSGVRASGNLATVFLDGSTVVTNSGVGLSVAGGHILSFGNNRVTGNVGGNGAPTSTLGTI